MFDKDAIDLIQESATTFMARQSINEAFEKRAVVALPEKFKLHDLEQYLPNRRRARGTMTTASLASFATYTKEHTETGATVFVDQNTMSATAVLNLGQPTEPGHADNKAVIKLEKTAAYAALTAIANGAGRSQKEVAEFMEDWSNCVSCWNESGEIKTSQAVAAVRKITIDSMRKLESEEQSLGASKSAFESVQASSKEPLPGTIRFLCVPYDDIGQRIFTLRLGVLTGEAVPKVNLRIIKIEEHQEAMAVELAARISAEFDGTIPVVLGNYNRGS